MASESHDNLLLQADWDDSALVAAFERHYNKYNEYHGHGGGRPKKIARTQANLHVHNPRPKETQPDSATADSKADEEGEIEETTVPDMEQVEDDVREAEEEEEGAIVDEETSRQKSNIDDGNIPTHIPEQQQTSAHESVRCSGPEPGLINANPGAIYTPPLPTHDPELANLLLSWYYAGYYTGRHEARQS